MESLTNLVTTLTALKTTSNAILTNMPPIMAQIATDESEIVEEVASRADRDEKDVLEHLQEMTLLIIADAEVVKKEIDNFARAVQDGPQTIETAITGYPFLGEVWYGDTYDGKEGIIALTTLLDELRVQEAKTSDDWIIEHAVSELTVVVE